MAVMFAIRGLDNRAETVFEGDWSVSTEHANDPEGLIANLLGCQSKIV